MRLAKSALFCVLLALSILEPITARKSYSGGRHSYPKSGGLSGSGGSHSYPSSGGLSGGGHSGGHGYPSSGGSHSYPSSGGSQSHNYPSSGGSHSYPSSRGSHTYPSSGGSHSYPSGGSSSRLSGNNNHGSGSTTQVHHHYHYTPPQQISYRPVGGGPPRSYPVYHGTPPTYVYQYKDSGSKYGTLLAGLALLNLGTLAGTAYAISQSGHGGGGGGGGGSSYKAQPGEICKFGVKKDNGDYEETRIDCQLISSFIYQEQAKAQTGGTNTTVVTTTTITNVTTNGAPVTPVNGTAVVANPLYEMLPNGTLVPVNVTSTNTTVNAPPAEAANNNASVTVTTTTTNTTTITNAIDVKGSPIEVTPGMQCYVIRVASGSNMKKTVPCGLLQTYADKSLKRNAAGRATPTFTLLAVIVAAFAIY